MSQAPHWKRLSSQRLSRRVLLRAGARAGLGASGLALVGCGGDEDDDATQISDAQTIDPSPSDDETAAEQAAEQASDEPEPPSAPLRPVRGGIVHLFAATEIHDRWDPHRSRFSQTQTFHSLAYNRLIRPSTVSDGSLEGDLAGLPEMPDEATHIFTLRPGARFWDRQPTNGRLFEADDVRFNIERQTEGLDIAGDPDPLFFRQDAFRAITSIAVQDTRSVTLTTDGPDATFLPTLIAGPWGWMTSPEAVEFFGSNWRGTGASVDLNDGTGPYIPVFYVPNGDLIYRRSENWWGEGAWPDGFFLRRVPNATIAEAYRDGRLDRADFPLLNTVVESLRNDFPADSAYELPLDSPVQLSFVTSDDPEQALSDPRLGRALGLAIDRFEMIDRLYRGEARLSGPVPWFLEGWALPEEDLVGLPGYRRNKEDDLPEIEGLVAAAGGADFADEITVVVPDLFAGAFPGVSESLRAMLERHTGLTLRINFQSYAEIREQLQDGALPAFFGWGAAPQQADPTATWLGAVHSDGAENFGRYANPDVDALIDEMRVTLNDGARKALAQRVQEILLQDAFWIQNVTNGIQLGIAREYLHQDPRVLDFAWAAHHHDQTWIDTDHADYPDDRTLPEAPEDEPEAELPPEPPTPDDG